jgi:hypothetical protein
VWDSTSFDRDRDETLAEKFVAFMGIRFPVESSSEDLEFHLAPIERHRLNVDTLKGAEGE